MTELIIMSGISGSGKSTRAREIQKSRPGVVVVSRDDIRITQFGIEFGEGVDQNLVTEVELFSIDTALRAGYDVVSDNTNLHPSDVIERLNIGIDAGAYLRLEQVDVPLKTALTNNGKRAATGGRFVPEHVITAQAHRFDLHKFEVQAVFEKLSGEELT